MPQLSINHLPNDILIMIFHRIPLSSLLPLELVCQRWKLMQEFVCCEIRTLALLGPSSNKTLNPRTSSSPSPNEMIQKCHQRYSISISRSYYHLTIPRPQGLSLCACELLLRKFPNISRLDLVQLGPLHKRRCIDYLLFLLNGWHLVRFTLIQDQPVVFFRTQNSVSLSQRFSSLKLHNNEQTSNSNHQNSLHRLLLHLSPSWQPYLRSLTMVTFDDLNQKYVDSCQKFDFSQLEELNLVRPWDSNRLLTQILLDSFTHPNRWMANIRRMILHSDSTFSSTFIREPSNYPCVQALFSNLTHLTVNFTNRTLLYLIKESCGTSLQSLHLSAVNLPLIDLALDLEPLQFRLTHLRLTYPSQCLDRSVEWKQMQDPYSVPLFVTIRQLHLSFSTLLHNPEIATPILGHLFPKLEQLTLDRNKVEYPTNGVACGRCIRMGASAFSCRYKLIRSLCNDASNVLMSLRKIRLQIESPPVTMAICLNGPQVSSKAKALYQYEVYCYKQSKWSIESTEL